MALEGSSETPLEMATILFSISVEHLSNFGRG